MSAPDPKVVALTEAERSLASLACQVSPYGTSRWFPEAAVEQIVAARVAAVVEPVLALADESAREMAEMNQRVEAETGRASTMRAFVFVDDLRAAVESAGVVAAGTQAFSPAALARVKAEALREAARAGRGFLGDEGHSSSAWDYLDMTADRIEAEAGDLS